ncbi:putative tetratricopeptide-like helical domain superfamily [Dioscorea sansibarensis]
MLLHLHRPRPNFHLFLPGILCQFHLLPSHALKSSSCLLEVELPTDHCVDAKGQDAPSRSLLGEVGIKPFWFCQSEGKEGNFVEGMVGFSHGLEAFRVSQFERCHGLARKGRLKGMRAVLRQMIDEEGPGSAPFLCEILLNNFQGWDSSSFVWDMLANVYARSEMVHDAVGVLSKMDGLNMQASISSYDSLMYNLRHTYLIWDIYEEIGAQGISCSGYTYNILIDGLCKQRKLQEAISFFQEEALDLSEYMEKNGVLLDVVTYNILINGFRLHGLTSETWKLVRKMVICGLKPDLVTYTILIAGHCASGNIEEGMRIREDLLACGFQLNIITYSIILNALFKRGQVWEVEQLLSEIGAIGLDLDIVSYSTLIHGYCKLGEIEKALEACRLMCYKRVICNSFAHRAILSCLCKKQMMAEAQWYLDNLSNSDQPIDIILYNTVIDGYVKAGDVHGAVGLYEQLITKGMTPTIVTYNSLINGFCRVGQLQVAEGFFRTCELHGLVPTAVTYTTLMDAFCRAGSVDATLKLFDEMVCKAIRPNVVTYSVVMKGLCCQGKLERAMAILECMSSNGIVADQIAYNTIIQGFCEVRKKKMAFYFFHEMRRQNLVPTPVTFNLLINLLCMTGEVGNAEKFLEHVLDDGVQLRKFAYSTIIKAQCAKGMPYNAIRVFERMLKAGFVVSIEDYSGAINRLCKRNYTNESKIFLNMMLHAGILPDQELCAVMYNAFYKNRDLCSFSVIQALIVKWGLSYP